MRFISYLFHCIQNFIYFNNSFIKPTAYCYCSFYCVFWYVIKITGQASFKYFLFLCFIILKNMNITIKWKRCYLFRGWVHTSEEGRGRKAAAGALMHEPGAREPVDILLQKSQPTWSLKLVIKLPFEIQMISRTSKHVAPI